MRRIENSNNIEEYVAWLNAQTITFQERLINEGIIPNIGFELYEDERDYVRTNSGIVKDLQPMTGIAFDDANRKLVYFTFIGNILKDNDIREKESKAELIYNYSIIPYDELAAIQEEGGEKIKIYTTNEKHTEIVFVFIDLAKKMQATVIDTMQSIFSNNLEKVRCCQKEQINVIGTAGNEIDVRQARSSIREKIHTIISENRQKFISCAIECEMINVENTEKDSCDFWGESIFYLNADRVLGVCPIYLKKQLVGYCTLSGNINYKAIKGYPLIILEYNNMDNLLKGKAIVKFQKFYLKLEITELLRLFIYMARQESMQRIIQHDFQLISQINEYVIKITENKEIVNIVYNFIDKIDSYINYLLNPDYLIQFEFLVIFGRYNYYDTIIDFQTLEVIDKDESERQYVIFSDWLKNKVFNYVSINENGDVTLSNQEIIDFKINYFDMLIDVLKTECDCGNVDKEEINKYVYCLLWYCIRKKITAELLELYGDTLHNIEQMELKDIVRQTVLFDDINEISDEYIGKLTCLCMEYKKCKNMNYLDCYYEVKNIADEAIKKGRILDFKNSLLRTSTSYSLTINDIDLMSGHEFEGFIAELFREMGYQTQVTQASGDQGIDVLAQKDGIKIGIQAKCYSGTVGNSAVQEVVAGKNYYNCDRVMVITNNFFTNAAKELAQKNNVILWDRNTLKEKIK